ncbi:TPA: hypothetical protein ACH3X1_014056 [Trebouxia sp. C0004]
MALIQTDLLAKVVLTVADQHGNLTLAGTHASIAGSKCARTVQSATIDAAPSTEISYGPDVEGASNIPPQEVALAGQSSDQAVESSALDM